MRIGPRPVSIDHVLLLYGKSVGRNTHVELDTLQGQPGTYTGIEYYVAANRSCILVWCHQPGLAVHLVSDPQPLMQDEEDKQGVTRIDIAERNGLHLPKPMIFPELNHFPVRRLSWIADLRLS